MGKFKQEDPDDDGRHAFADTTGRFPRDQKLRAAGFEIHGRARDAEPVWRRGGRLFPQSAALDLVGLLKKAARG